MNMQIEFYITPDGDVTVREYGKPERQLVESDTDFIQRFKTTISDFYPGAYEALLDIYSKSKLAKSYYDFLIVRRFIKCNFSMYDNVIDLDENWNFKFEFVSCPLRGECKFDKVICNPKFNSTLSDRELEVMEMIFRGVSDDSIAEKLFISLNTVNNHRKNSFKKLGIHSMPEFMRYAMHNNLFKK